MFDGASHSTQVVARRANAVPRTHSDEQRKELRWRLEYEGVPVVPVSGPAGTELALFSGVFK